MQPSQASDINRLDWVEYDEYKQRRSYKTFESEVKTKLAFFEKASSWGDFNKCLLGLNKVTPSNQE